MPVRRWVRVVLAVTEDPEAVVAADHGNDRVVRYALRALL
jgi:hypothetical protein